jgi:hypothetical protein
MATQQFRVINFRADSLVRIKQMQDIIEEYQNQGLTLTARQLYYQFVSRDFIPNTARSYKNLTALLADARYAGLVDWNAIEDRVREPTIWSDFPNISACVNRAVRNFRLPRWDGQPNYVELWVEKDALAGVLEPLAAEFHATLLVNRGYSSASAMYEAAQRFMKHSNQAESEYYDEDEPEREPVLFYLGDHDPSGEDMVRDIGVRLKEFGVERLEVRKLALTMEQVKKYRPPPNPAKTTDSRYENYAAEHGRQSWEVDALPPNVLQDIIRKAFEGVVDRETMDAVIEREEEAKVKLKKALAKIDKDS